MSAALIGGIISFLSPGALLTGVAFLSGSMSSISIWLIDTFRRCKNSADGA